MAAAGEAGPGGAGARFFCTAGRGLEPFVLREVRARLAATQVEYISGKVFFSTCCGLNMLKKLKSAERIFLLVRKRLPLARHRGKILRELQSLISDDPGSWLGAVSIWKNLLEADAEGEKVPLGHAKALKRKAGSGEATGAEKQRAEAWAAPAWAAGPQGQRGPAGAQGGVTFRVSCRCSGAVGRACTAQEAGRVLGVALKKQFGWQADLRRPGVEIFVHLNDIYSVVGIPIFRAPLASRAYIQTAGLRSTVAWALASLADIQAGAFVLDPMCGLGTILLEAAKEWPDVYYVGTDVSEKQLLGASDNLKAAGLQDKVELLRASVTGLPWPSGSVDAVISDVPFGKKFRLGAGLGHVLREMQRVLRVGGTLVLLLSEDPQGRLSGWNKSSTTLSPGAGPADEHGPAMHSVARAEMEPNTERTGVGVARKEPPPGVVVCVQAVARAEPPPEGVVSVEGVARAEPPPGGVVSVEGVARAEPPPGGVVSVEGMTRAEPPSGGVVCGEGVGRVEPPPGGVACGEGVAKAEPPPGGVVCMQAVACGEGVARAEPPPGGVARAEPPPGGVVCVQAVARGEPPPGGVACAEEGSLILVEQFPVSLGKTEAFLCKYKKGPQLGPPLASGQCLAVGEDVLDRVRDPGPQVPLQA